jgi:hypothetical protein
VGAPLLALDENRIDRVDDDHDSRVFSDPSTGTGFVWALTSSAGISGLLFGYEYERGFIFQTLSANISPFPVLPKVIVFAIAADVLSMQHRGNFFDSRLNRF